jgi:predicted dehydrogenase
MARVRGKALLDTGQVSICGVAARHQASADKLAGELGCDQAFADYRRLAELRPDAVLIEVPHAAQDEIVRWALAAGFHVLIGGCLAASSAEAREICRRAQQSRLIVEAGYQARYSAEWTAVRDLVAGGHLGQVAAVRSIALWGGDPATWYYNQAQSGGMPLTHMTYCFINLVRWLLGRPTHVSAFANRKHHTAADLVSEETCVANLLFADEVPYSLTAGFVKPGELPGWSVTIIGTEAAAELVPGPEIAAALTVYRGSGVEKVDLSTAANPFVLQAEAFLAAIDGRGAVRNPPDDAAIDIAIAEAVVRSVREKTTIALT